MVFSRLSDYLRENNLLDSRQSAYRAHHSVETLLVNLSNDILMEMDLGRITVLVSLDLSSTFDTVHHDILLNILSSLGIQDVVLDWLKSYLTDRQQVMYINGTQSDPISLNCGVPQGSVGGPMLFSIYLSELRDVLSRHHIRYHCYADDVQIYVSFVPNQQNASSAIQKLESCLVDVIQWMGSHSLKLNNDKSEMILLGSVAHLAKVKVSHINIGNCKIKPSVVCKNLGVTFDSAMSMSNQVSNICKSVWYQLRNLGFIRKYLTRSTTEKIVHALISSRFDYCNSLFCLLQQNQISRLQRLQNTAARLVTLSSRRTHITPVLNALHWLPVQYRIQYKLLLLVFHSLHGSAPQYNCQLITRYNPSRCLRSSTSSLLVVPHTHNNWGDRAFSHAGPLLWNNLPLNIRNMSSIHKFKEALKTHFFTAAFH